ncbi:nucleotidyltransferase [Gorillibacterium massiliense]|uniref:nucleotidyltransferase n=1 Tax=Gorillibacterium massiliense TaxID=1280390 RepID=UPI0004BA61D3|nr:nucleotidyltransferase [Gorillibacterium massiliense]
MDDMQQAELKERFMAATESFIGKIKSDPNIIAVIVGGSLAYDVIWEKSDIDMTIVVRDQQLKNDHYCIDEDGLLINAFLLTRSHFKRVMERSIGGSFSQSYFAKGRMVYTIDESLREFFEDMKSVGSDDIALSALQVASHLLSLYEKAYKWLTVRKDPLYAQYYLLRAAESIAFMELILRGEPNSRESIQKALALNPDAITPFYQNAMSHHMSEAEIAAGIKGIESYLERHIPVYSKPVIAYLSDQELKTVTLMAKHFQTEPAQLIVILDYLADKGIIEKAAQMIRITPKGKLAVEEIGFLYIP